MDPDVALESCRMLSSHLIDILDDDHTDVLELAETASAMAEHFQALDGWMSKGGFTPKGW